MSEPKPVIFVVDGDATISGELAEILRQSDYSVYSFTRPFDALHWAQVQTPDLLLSEVATPEIFGIDLAMLMIVLSPGCKVVLYSSTVSTRDLPHSRQVSEHGFYVLSQPIHPGKVLGEINDLLKLS